MTSTTSPASYSVKATALTEAEVRAFLRDVDLVEPDDAGDDALARVLTDLAAADLPPGTAVMLALPNGLPFVTLALAMLLRGLVPILLPPSAPIDRLKRMAMALGANAIITAHGAFAGRKGANLRAIGPIGALSYFSGLNAQRFQPGEVILLTSGTSGIFTGCLFNLAALFLNGQKHATAVGQTAADTVLISLPMYYSFAFVAQLLATYRIGGHVVLSGPPFTPEQFARTIDEHAVHQVSVTPVMVQSLLRSASRTLPPCLRRMTIGGAQIAAQDVEALIAHNPNLEIFLTYGLTEAGPRVSTLAAHAEPPHRYASVGRPLPGVAVRLANQTPGAQRGELVINTDTRFIRTLGNRPTPFLVPQNDSGEIKTGDLFTIDDDGYLYFHGRGTKSIVIRGEKLVVKSICEIAETIPGVSRAEAWIATMPSGELSFALDVYVTDSAIDDASIRRQLAKVLLRSEQPTTLAVHPEQPGVWRKNRN